MMVENRMNRSTGHLSVDNHYDCHDDSNNATKPRRMDVCVSPPFSQT